MTNDSLEITYHVSGFHRAVYVPAPEWPGCRFEQGDNLDVALQITETGLLPDTDVGALIAFADLRIRRLVLAWELRYGRRLKLTRRNTVLPSFPQCEASVEIADSAIVSDRTRRSRVRRLPSICRRCRSGRNAGSGHSRKRAIFRTMPRNSCGGTI